MSVWVRAAASAAASAAAAAELLTAVFFFFFRRVGTGSNGDRFLEFHWLNRFSI